MSIDTEIGTENTDTRATKDTTMNRHTLPDTRPVEALADHLRDLGNEAVPVLYLRGIDDFLQSAERLMNTVLLAYEGGIWPKLENRLFLAYLSVAEARAALLPFSTEPIDQRPANERHDGIPAYLKVSNNIRYEAASALKQALADLELALGVVDQMMKDDVSTLTREADTERRLIAEAHTSIATARASIPYRAVDPADNTVPF